MKTKLCIYSQPNYLLFRTMIGSGSGALKSAVLHQKPYILVPFSSQSFAYAKLSRLKPPPSMAELIVVYFYILCNIKKGLGFLRAEPLSSNFEDRRGYRGGKKVLSDKSVFPPLKTAPIDDEAKKHNENLPGMGGVYNTVNLHVYHYAGNNPVKYVDPDGESVVVVTAVVVWGVNALLLTIGIIDAAGPSKAEHLARNDNQAGLAPSDRETMDKLVKLGLFSDWGNTGTHNLSGDDTVMNRLGGLVLGARGSNKDYRGATGTVFEGCQFVYDSNGKLVTDSLNQGTFDTASPSGVSGVIKHSVKDVSPWLKWGNGTANNQVMSAELENSIKNIYNDFDGGKISKDQAKNEIENLVKNYIKHNNLE